jgi:hypothetical protein
VTNQGIYNPHDQFSPRTSPIYWLMLLPLLVLGVYWRSIEKLSQWLQRRPRAMRLVRALRLLPVAIGSF